VGERASDALPDPTGTPAGIRLEKEAKMKKTLGLMILALIVVAGVLVGWFRPGCLYDGEEEGDEQY